MGQSQYAGSIQAVRVHSVDRPWGVTLVAVFQWLKGAGLVATALMLRLRPEAVVGPDSAFYPLLYVALRGNSSLMKTVMNGGNFLTAVILLLGAYLLYVASGLWKMRPVARKAVMFTSGMTLVLYLKSVAFARVEDGSLSGMSFFAPNLHNVHLLLFLDTAIFVYLMRGRTAAKFSD